MFLLAGYELDLRLLREQAGRLAMAGWVISATIAVAAVAILGSFGYVRDFVPVGLALTTTALGTLLPILHDNDMLSGRFGRYVLAAGAVGELFPIVAISLFLTKRGDPSIAAAIAQRAPKIPAVPAVAAAEPGTAGDGGVVSEVRAAGEITAEGKADNAGEPGD